MNTESTPSIQLQGIGRVPAVAAAELKVNDQLMYNGGSVYQVVKIVDATPKFFDIYEVSTATCAQYTRRTKKTTLVARVPEKYRRPLGHDAPATDYRAQVQAPTGGLGWVTVSHGDTFEAAVNGLTVSNERSYFGSVMLDQHGLGYTSEAPDGRADSIKAMKEGAALTAADGHSFRVLPPERTQAPAPAAVEGTVLAAGHALGILPEHADNQDARDAYGALVAAGHTPAELSGEYDDDGNDTARGTGFIIDLRGVGRSYGVAVLVGHLVDGVDMWESLPDAERRKILRGFRRTLRAAGWETDKSVKGGRLYAWRTSPLPEEVSLAQTRGEVTAPAPYSAEETHEIAREEFAKVDTVRPSPAAEQYAVGTRVRHSGQEWATPVVAPRGTAVVVAVGREHQDGTREYEILTGEDFSRRPGPNNPLARRTEWNSSRTRFVAPPRFEVKQVGRSTAYGVWDSYAELWRRMGVEETCRETADGLNVTRLKLDAYGRVLDPQRPTEGPYATYMQPDDGYAADAHRATLEDAQQCAEDGATARGLNPKGLGYHWDVTKTTSEHITWTLRSVYEWAKPTGISVEGPRPYTA
ncbi:hypothetical protein [Streptomyces sp. NPDC088727]|uniref:hypothetical protein n=1 Tax=Streptomyces sp. NPDC088727 TaxID=3365875 RepID=UPI00380B7068